MFTRRILTVLTIVLVTVLSEHGISQTSQTNLPDYPTGLDSEPSGPPRILTNPNRNPAQQDFQRFQMDMQRNMSPGNNMARINPEQRIRQMQQMAQEQEEQAMKQALGVDDAQWKAIKPKIEKVKHYKEQASVNIGLPFNSTFTSTSNSSGGQSFSGGFQTSFGGGGFGGTSMPNVNQIDQSLTKGERICRELQTLLDSQSVTGQNETSRALIQAKITELQQARAEAKKELAKAQEELKKGLDITLQARLILLGLLE